MAIMEENSVKLVIDSGIARIVVNRPKSLNALNLDVLQGLSNGIQKSLREESLRVITITGAGEKAFVAGADIATMSDLGPRAIADYVELGQRTMRAIEQARVPVIAAVNGFALGGGLELALSCDIIIAAESARVGQPEVNLGVIPGFGGTQRLIQRCGVGTTRRLVYTGDMLKSDEALRLGVVDIVVPDDQLEEVVEKTAGNIASKGPLAVQGAKRVIRESQQTALLSGLRLEVEEFLSLFATADREEGMDAFLQKRKAEFNGR